MDGPTTYLLHDHHSTGVRPAASARVDALQGDGPVVGRPKLSHVRVAEGRLLVSAGHLRGPEQVDGRDEAVLLGKRLPDLLEADELRVETELGVADTRVAPALRDDALGDGLAASAAEHDVVACTRESENVQAAVGSSWQ